ncbi:major facilitator superfamily domain-containing protein [Boeremia exigua]|uniref:major facilitator superfamily domain-containing protein n=1 Tax=Boeremia exigua TaxID=749465 RepID=UPI001E8D8485|nr:major facilitator superfamily domain-containing protein [Boeremia exigua]KAH6643824.1 major facilitator superfamily domain-containing protein [Boeremia exigua]
MRSPIEFEKDHHYDRCRDSIDSEFSSSDTAEEPLAQGDNVPLTPQPPPYSAFSLNRRRFMLGAVTAAGFFGPLTGAVYLPSLVLFEEIFKVSATAINATVSVYMVVFAIAPLFGAVASDIGGRKLVYMVGLGSFLVANVLLATLPAHIALLFILRIFQAFGSCIVFSVGAGTVADITEPANRASSLAWFLMGPQLGPVLGPLIGGGFADVSRWRWVFGFLALTCFPVYCAIMFCMPETLRSLVGNGAALAQQPWFSIPKLRTQPITDTKGPKVPRPSFRKFMRLLKYPPHLIVSFNGAFQFAGLYGMYISFPSVLKGTYNWSTAQVSYAYLAPGISMFIASIIVGRGSDWLRRRAIAKSADGKFAPEKRIAYQLVGFSIAAAGKFMYGWSCQSRITPAAGLIGSALSSIGTSIVFVTSTSFQTECDPAQTASLVALGGLLRNIAAAIAAVVMDGLLDKAGVGWTFSIFGAMDLLCIPGVLLIIFKGAEMRAALKAQG